MFSYIILISFWIMSFFLNNIANQISIGFNIFFCILFTIAAVGFLNYGSRLYFMLKQFPIESQGKHSKMKEVGWVTIICTMSFAVRAALLLSASFALKMKGNDIFIGTYYFAVEVLPSALVLFILRKLPPKVEDSQGSSSNPVVFNRLRAASYDRYATEYYRVSLEVN